jgi:hypothetical protein
MNWERLFSPQATMSHPLPVRWRRPCVQGLENCNLVIDDATDAVVGMVDPKFAFQDIQAGLQSSLSVMAENLSNGYTTDSGGTYEII